MCVKNTIVHSEPRKTALEVIIKMGLKYTKKLLNNSTKVCCFYFLDRSLYAMNDCCARKLNYGLDRHIGKCNKCIYSWIHYLCNFMSN